MLKKTILILISLITIFSAQVFAIGCTFDTYNSSCPRFSTTFNTFNLQFSPIDKVDDFDAVLYNKYNRYNQILIHIDKTSRKITNVNPFVESGVYILEVKTYNKGKVVSTTSYEYIFDNLEPAPPIISANLQSNTNQIIISGKTEQEKIKVVAEILGKSSVEVTSNNNIFSITLDNLDTGINFVTFYTLSENGMKSFPVERMIVANGAIEKNFENVSSIIIGDLSMNKRTYKFSQNQYYTSKKLFYVTGTAIGNKGAEIRVNGEKAIFDGNNYGAFILLNLGQNEIVVQSGLESEIVYVNYINAEFRFSELNYDKVFEGNFVLKGKTTINLPFDIYINGINFGTQNTFIREADGIYSFEFEILQEDLLNGKNHIYLLGYNNERVEDFIYKDTENPVITKIFFDKISANKELVFKITDDISVNDKNVVLNIASVSYSTDSNLMRGDYYTFDISDLENGVYNYELSAVDMVGKKTSLTGQINIANTNTLIEKITNRNDNIIVLGNNLFVPNSIDQLKITPSKYIAFNKIYLDGIEQIDYDIKQDGSVELNLNFNKSTGILSFSFINSNRDELYQEYIYYSDAEKPQIQLDYIYSAYGNSDNLIKVTGKITDSYFNWSSLLINGQNSVSRYGNYFEAYVKPIKVGSNPEVDLIITGRDYCGNSLNRVYDDILTDDTTRTFVSFTSNSNIISASLLNSQFSSLYSHTKMRNYLYSYDGFDVRRTYLKPQFELPVSQRNGLTNINIKGVESSENLFEKDITRNLDYLNPEIYLFYNETLRKYLVVVDGTYDNVSLINITSINGNLDVSNCNYKPFVYSSCKFLDNINGINEITVYAEDNSHNFKNKIFNLSDAIIVSKVIDLMPPQIILNSDISGNVSPIQILKDSSYIEPGATCTDNVDRVCNVIISGNVDTSILGSYSLSYFAKDQKGNNVTVVRLVRVVETPLVLPVSDVTPPVIILSNNSAILEVLVNSTFIFPTATCTDNVDKVCNVIISGNVDTSVPGNYTIIYSTTDSSNNLININQTVMVVTNLSQGYVCENKLEDIYLSVDNNITKNNNFIIEGSFIIKCDSVLSIEILNGLDEVRGTCSIGENSFVCNTVLLEGDNLLKIVITGIDGHKINKYIQIKFDGINPEILIKSLSANSLYKASESIYYINDPNLILHLNLSEKALLKIISDGTRTLNQTHDGGEFVLNINLTNVILGQETKEFELFIEVQDSAGNIGNSSILTLIYNRITSVFVDVSVE